MVLYRHCWVQKSSVRIRKKLEPWAGCPTCDLEGLFIYLGVVPWQILLQTIVDAVEAPASWAMVSHSLYRGHRRVARWSFELVLNSLLRGALSTCELSKAPSLHLAFRAWHFPKHWDSTQGALPVTSEEVVPKGYRFGPEYFLPLACHSHGTFEENVWPQTHPHWYFSQCFIE